MSLDLRSDEPADPVEQAREQLDRMEEASRIAWDLDGTLLVYPDKLETAHPTDRFPHAEPCETLCSVLRGAENHRHIIVTGRSDDYEQLTLQQLTDAELDDHARELYMQEAWTGTEAYIDWITTTIGALSATEDGEDVPADLYVGDLEANREAAERAGVRYIDADELRSMAPYDRAELLREIQH
jgi:phosphoglycolate phosphatase-like HAD superfamily hydrolase